MHFNVTIKNVSWLHFSRATLYIMADGGVIFAKARAFNFKANICSNNYYRVISLPFCVVRCTGLLVSAVVG